jgi:hypothetical protein
MQRWNHGFSSPLWQALEMIETTMVETSPSRMCISGPCFLAKSLNARWGREPIKWCMLPMIGSLDGPGGRFEVERLVFRTMNMKMMKSKKVINTIGKDNNWNSMI